MTDLRAVLASLVYYANGYSVVEPADILTVEFRQGCAEVDVTFRAAEVLRCATIDAAPLLTALVESHMV